jgi:methionyl-tRNA synthetase
MLLSAGLDIPKKVFSHGWWTVEGQKMSKSLGNVIDPVKLADKYSVDAVRYFLIRETPFGEDGEFYEKKFIERINGELVADLGNLIYRVLTLAEKFDGKIEGKPELEKKLDIEKVDRLIDEVKLTEALLDIWNFIRATNKYVNKTEPWRLEGKELGNVIYNLLEATRIISILISPYLPETAEKISKQLGVKLGKLKGAKFGKFKGKIKKGKYLFRKVE